jgi:hypothetical protein
MGVFLCSRPVGQMGSSIVFGWKLLWVIVVGFWGTLAVVESTSHRNMHNGFQTIPAWCDDCTLQPAVERSEAKVIDMCVPHNM